MFGTDRKNCLAEDYAEHFVRKRQRTAADLDRGSVGAATVPEIGILVLLIKRV